MGWAQKSKEGASNRTRIRIGGAVLLATLAAGTTACSTAATIRRANGPTIREPIVGGTPDAIVLESGSVVPRSEIVSIRHPGTPAAVIGSVLLGYGVINIAAGMAACQDAQRFSTDEERGVFCTALFIPLAVGTGMTMWAVAVNGESKEKARESVSRLPATSEAPSPPSTTPVPADLERPASGAPVPPVATVAPTLAPPPTAPPVSPTVELSISSTPEGEVFIDGQFIGRTPIVVRRPLERHHVRVVNDLGTREWWVPVSAGTTVHLTANMLEEAGEDAEGEGDAAPPSVPIESQTPR